MYNYVLIRDRKTTLNTFEKSDREVLLMLRGLARSYKGWLGAEEDLSEKFDVICIDLPGVGLSKNEKLLYKVEDMAEKIFEVLKSLDINSLYILAPSLGSIVSYELIKKLGKDVVKGVILVVPSHSGIGVNRISPLAARTLSSTPFVSKDVRIAMLRNMLIGKNSAGENIIDSDLALEKRWRTQILQDSDELGRKGLLAQLLAAGRYFSKDGMDYIRKNRIPLKGIVSMDDRMIPTSHEIEVFQYMKHPKAELIELRFAGHDFIVTHRKEVVEIVEKFILEKQYEPANAIDEKLIVEKKDKKGILFFFTTLFAGILLLWATNKYKKRK